MKYNLYVNQIKAIELNIKNIQEALIFDLLTTVSTWAEPEIIDKKIYYWVARKRVCDMLPILNLKADTVYRYLKHLTELGLIEYIKIGKKDCISITDLGKTYLIKDTKNTMSEKNPSNTQNSEKNPSKFGKKSENTMSEKNPTYTTITNTTIKDTKNTGQVTKTIKEYFELVSEINSNLVGKERMRLETTIKNMLTLDEIEPTRLINTVKRVITSNNNFLASKLFNSYYLRNNFLEMETQVRDIKEENEIGGFC